MKLWYWVLAACICLIPVVPAGAQTAQLDTLYKQARGGSRLALEKLVRLTRSHKRVQYHIGRHQRTGRLGKLAAGNLKELVVFSANELVSRPMDFSRDYLVLLRAQMPNLRYFPLYQQWGLCQLADDSSSVYHLRRLPAGSTAAPGKPLSAGLFEQFHQLDSLWQERSPLILRELPQYAYAHRHTRFAPDDLTTFMEQITGMQVGVRNYAADTVYAHYAFDNILLRNYTVFWARHYQQFRWNPQRGQFESPDLVVHPRSVAQQLLDRIASPDTAVAFDAYTTFIEQNIRVPWRGIAERAGVFPNHALPTFWERFIPSKQAMRAYLRQNGLPLTLPPALQQQSLQLLQPLAFGVRYRLENQLIEQLNPEQITAFELLMLDYQQHEAAQESVGRVLDVWYSRNWLQITGSEKQLSAYLKKVSVYKKLGIVGISNNFIYKLNTLRGQPRRAVHHLRATAPDADVRQVARRVLRPHWSYRARRTFSRVRQVSPPAKLYKADSLRLVLLQQGLQVYTAGKLNAARVDTALKYDAPLGFVGGHLPRATTLQPLIRLLEAHFQTDLGFGPAFGYWNMSGSPSVVHRARAWRWYLRRQGLVGKDTEPISFVQKNSFRSRSGSTPLRRRLRRLKYWWRTVW